MRKDIVIPLLALVGGAAGFALRRVQLRTGFESDTGLAIPGCPAALALIVLSAAVAAALLLLCRGSLRPFRGYDDAMLTHDPGARAMGNAAAFLVLVAGAWELQELFFTDWPQVTAQAASIRAMGGNTLPILLSGLLLPILSVVLCVAAALSLLMLTRNNFWGERRGDRSVFLLLPAYGSCLWLILTYRELSNDPVVQQYAYQLLAIVCITLALYFTVTLSFGKHPHPAAALFFSLLGVYFSLVTLADGYGLTPTMLFLAAILWLTSQSFVLLRNGARLPWPLPPFRPDQDDGDDGADSRGN